jgi:uncharacterized protein YcaQ
MHSPAKLRRIALNQQGLLRNAPFGNGKQATRRAIQHLGYVQIDTISVVERAHHHVLRTRVPNYRGTFLDALLREHKVFEYWYHAAAYLPMEDYRYALPHMHAMRRGEARWQRSNDKRLMKRVKQRIAGDGPLRARDFEDSRAGRQGWWDWKPAKRALEQLFMQGDLMIVGREGFQKVYDLTERVLPPGVDTTTPTTMELAEHLVDASIRCHGLVTAKFITYLRQGAPLRAAVKTILQQRQDHGGLTSFALDNGERVYADPELMDNRAPSAPAKIRILSPFDNAVIQRDRGQALFKFNYQMECYVPEAKRRFGYFCLPMLYRDRFIGRVDCKVHRKEGRLDVRALHLENMQSGNSDEENLADRIAEALAAFAEFNRCTVVNLLAVVPGHWRNPLHYAIDQHMSLSN